MIPEELIARLDERACVVVLTGAGISAASGVPTFRGTDGLWKNYRATDLATPEAFAQDPALVWEWYGWRRDLVRACQPNPAHRALVDLAPMVARLAIVTQNVDGLHERASAEVPVLRLHGSLWQMRCVACGREIENHEPGPAPGELPRCTSCGELLRPSVVWFGEALDDWVLGQAGQLTSEATVFMVVGTSGVVYPAASFAALAAQAGAYVVSFNVDDGARSDSAHDHVNSPCEVSMPLLVREVAARRP